MDGSRCVCVFVVDFRHVHTHGGSFLCERCTTSCKPTFRDPPLGFRGHPTFAITNGEDDGRLQKGLNHGLRTLLCLLPNPPAISGNLSFDVRSEQHFEQADRWSECPR